MIETIDTDHSLTKDNNLSFSFSRTHGVQWKMDLSGNPVILYHSAVKISALQELQRSLGRNCQLKLIHKDEFDNRLQERHEQQGENTISAINGFDEDMIPDFQSLIQELNEPEDLLENADDAPVIRLLNAMFTEAVRAHASDLHVEPYENSLRVRMRIDGELKEILRARKELCSLLVSRIKVIARLDIAEKRLPQDGRISLRFGNRMVDVRVSSIPSGKSERVVMRLLDKQSGRIGLQDLGMSSSVLKKMMRVISQPSGIILVTGPTGSGKTTSLYAALTHLNDQRRNIMTIEDPVEYELDGISQTQVNSRIGMSFANGLRAILRQDPDVVMIGEIRDPETAQNAVQASLTGHLVFSTLHTNTAIGAITRLRDIGVEPFLLASSFNAVLAQRLIRLLCPQCKQAYKPDKAECSRLGIENDIELYHAVGCEHCSQKGYRGRTGIYELIEVTEELKRLIHDGEGEHRMVECVRESTESLEHSGMALAIEGKTSYEEIIRITGES